MPGGYAPQQQIPYQPEFQSVAERNAWYRANPVQHNNAANAPAFQPQDPNDPYYQRSDIAPFIQGTNRDVLGGGHFGYRNFLRTNPVGTIAAFTGLAAGGAALAGGLGGAGAGSGLSFNGIGGTGGLGSFGGGGMGLWDHVLDAIPAVTSLFNSSQQSNAAGRAADAQTAAAREGIAETRRQYDQNRADQMPWLEAGRGALGRLEDPANSFTASPGYAFTRAEGTRDIGNSFAARGGALSGNALRGLDAYNTGLASNEFNNWWNQQSGLAGTGQTSAQSLGGQGAYAAGNVSNLLGNAGDARSSGIINQSNAMTGGLNDLAGLFGNWRKGPGTSNGGYGGGYGGPWSTPPIWGS